MELRRGKVVNNNSPYKDGRVQVRIPGIHPQEDQEGFEQVNNDDLPWIEVLNGDYLSKGIGTSNVPELNSWVYVLVQDNLDDMFVVGTLKSSNDTNLVMRGEGESKIEEYSGQINEQPELDSSTEYPHSRSMFTKSGHYLMYDDTEGNERIKTQHRTGTYYEIRPDGNFQFRSVSGEKNTVIIQGSLEQIIEKTVKAIIKDNVDLLIEGTLDQVIQKQVNATLNDTLDQYVQKQVNVTMNDTLTQLIQKQVQQTVNDSVDVKVQQTLGIDAGGNINMKASSINMIASGPVNIKGTPVNIN